MKTKSIFFAFLCALLCFGCVKPLEVNVEFAETAYEIFVGEQIDLAAEVKVENSNDAPKFSTSDEAVAKFVSEGVIIALAPGDVTITATVAEKSATTKLYVKVVLAEEILVEAPDSVVAASEDWTKVVAEVEPGNYNSDNLVWTFTPSSDDLGLEYKKVTASEYEFKVAQYKDGAKVEIKVSDKNSDISNTVAVVVTEPVKPEVAARIVRLSAPDAITESSQTWGTVTAEVVADGSEEYDYENLVWEFAASDAEATGFAYEKVSAAEYRLRFTTYKEGANATVKVTDKIGGKFATKTIAVAQQPQEGVSSIVVTPKSVNLFVGKTQNLTVSTKPENYDKTLLVWESSDSKVATVQNGVVTAVAAGVAKVKVTDSVSGLSDECEVTVSNPVVDVEVKTIILDVARLEMTVGDDSYQLKATCLDEAGNEVKDFGGLVWTASKDVNEYGISFDVVAVSDQGVIAPKAAGRTTVTVMVNTNHAVKATCEVVVNAKEIKVEKLWLSPAEKSIEIGNTYTLEVTSEPEFSTVADKTIAYVSSNPDVATVSDEGLVKGIALGEAVITATAASGVAATAKVIVCEEVGDNEDVDFTITLTPENVKLDQKPQIPQFETLNIKVAYSNGYVAKDTRWVLSDETLATVTPYDGGVAVYAKFDGILGDEETKELTLTHYAGTKSASVEMEITRALPKKVEFVGLPENNTLYLGESFGPDFGVKVYPEQASQYVTYWGNVEIYSVANGSTVASKVGYWELNATAEEGTTSVKTTTFIKIIPRPVNGGVLSNSQLTIEQGKSATIEVDFDPMIPTDQQILICHDYNVEWTSSDPAVATVENGKVTAHAVGTATISAKLSNGEVLTCAVTVKEPAPVTINVGDYYYSDGTTSAELDPSKTVVGVVFSVDNPTQMGDSKLAENHPEATHGLVVALEETANIRWQEEASYVGEWAAGKGYGLLGAEDRKCGYSNTMYLKMYNEKCPAENKVLVADCAPKVTLGEKTSGWYLPSYAELMMLYKYEEGTRSSLVSDGAIANKIKAAGGTPFSIIREDYDMPDGMLDAPSYWTSTENSTNYIWAYRVHFLHGGAYNKSKAGKNYYIARYIFAF